MLATFRKNMDCNLADLRSMERDYKAVFIPGHCVMDADSAETIANYAGNGGIAGWNRGKRYTSTHPAAYVKLPGRACQKVS
jgi:hypothetical protein